MCLDCWEFHPLWGEAGRSCDSGNIWFVYVPCCAAEAFGFLAGDFECNLLTNLDSEPFLTNFLCYGRAP